MAGYVWDDSALDELDGLPDEEAVKVFEALDEAGRNELISAMDARASRASPAMPAAEAATPMAASGTPSFVQAPEWSGTAPSKVDPLVERYTTGVGGRSVASPVDPHTEEPFNMGLMAFGGVRDTRLKKPSTATESYREAAGTVVKGAQQHVGMPVATQILKNVPDEGPLAKTLNRDLLSNIAGKDIYQYGGGSTDTAVAANQSLDASGLPTMLGAKPSEYIRGGLRELGNPVNHIPLGGGAKAVQIVERFATKAPVLAKILLRSTARAAGEGIENMAVGAAIDSVDPNISSEDMAGRRLGDFIGGAGISGVRSVGSGLLKAAKNVRPVKVSQISADEIAQLAEEIRHIEPDGMFIRTAEQAGVDPKTLKPMAAAIRVHEAGKPYGRIITADGIVHDTPIFTERSASAFHKYLEDHGVALRPPPMRELRKLPLYEDDKLNFIFQLPRAAKKAEEAAVFQQGGRLASGDSGTVNIHISDAQPAKPASDSLLVGRSDGTQRIEEIAVTHPNKRPGEYSVGDRVADVNGEVGVLVDKGGVLHIKLDGGRIREVSSHNIRMATEAEIAASNVLNAGTERPVRDILIDAMQTGRELDIREAAQLTGLDPIAAREVLGDLEAQGLVKQYGNTWDVTPAAPKPRLRQEPALPAIAETRGVTPSQPILHGGAVLPDELPADFQGDINAATKLLKKMLGHDVAGGMKRFFKGWADPAQRGPVQFHHHIREVRGVKQFEEARALEEARIRRLLPNVKTEDAFDKDLDLAIRAKTPEAIDQIMQKHGPAWQAFRDEAHKLISEKAADDVEFRRLTGMDFDASPADGAAEAYVARRYWAFTKPKEWARYIQRRTDILEQAVAGVKKDMPDSSDAAIAQELRKLLGTADPVAAYKNSKLSTRKSLLKRDEIPEHIRKFLGEYQSGIMNLAETRATQKAVIASLQTWEALAADPKSFSRVAVPDPTWKQLENDPRKYGAAAGGFVPDEIFEAFGGLAENAPRSAEWAMAFQRFVKGNQTAWNPRSHLRSWVGNLDSSVAAGGLNPFNVVGSARLLSEAWEEIKAYKADPLAGGLVFEARKYGADYTGFASKELKAAYDNSFKEFDRVFGQKPKNLLDIMKAAASPYAKTTEALGGLLDLGDQLFRVANYIGLRRKYLAKGMPLEEAARMASERINKYFWNAQNVGRHIERARSGAVGIVAPYLTPLAEDSRTRINMVRGFASEDRAYKARMIAWHGAFWTGAILGGKGAWWAAGAFNEWAFDDKPRESYQEAQSRMTKSSETFKPLNGLLPYMDSQGRAQMFNYTPFSFPAQFLTGNVDDPELARIAANFVTAPLGGLPKEMASKAMAGAGLVRDTSFKKPGLLEGEAGLAEILNFMAENSITPTGPTRLVRDIMKTTDKRGPMDTPLTPGQVIGRTLFDVQPVPKNKVPRKMELERELSAAEKAMDKGAEKKDKGQLNAGKARAKFLIKQEQERNSK